MDQKRVTRKLRAILSADVQGYSRLMGDDEVATVKTITEYREIFSSIVTQHNGRVVDSPGDNILSEFASVVDAVQCAVEIQRVLKAKNEDLPENRRMIFRIGVNLGDVIHEGDRIYGDGVNIAARIESLADGGGICISGSAYEQIENKLALGYNFIGEHSVKNIAKPIRVYKVPMGPGDFEKEVIKPKLSKKAVIALAVVLILGIAAAAIWTFYPSPPTKSTNTASNKISATESSEKAAPLPLPDKPSIAVLPFDNISGDPKEDFFCDGITENIITSLSKIEDMSVIARNSTFTYKGKPVKVEQVARELGVRYVLEGSIQRSNDRVRINVQLIDAETGNHLWAERYDRMLKDIFALQDEITMKVIEGLRIKIVAGDRARLWSKGTENLDAYLKILKAGEHYMQYSKDAFSIVRQLCYEAIALDPNYSAPYSMLAWTYIDTCTFGWAESCDECYKQAFELAQKALSLNDLDTWAHLALSQFYMRSKQCNKSISEAKRAVMIDPNGADVNMLYGISLSVCGKHEEAIDRMNKAIHLNPISPVWYSFSESGILFRAGRYEEAIPKIKEWIRVKQKSPAWFFTYLGEACWRTGRYKEAVSAYKKALDIKTDYLPAHVGLAISYSLAGHEVEAHTEVAEILRIDPKYSLEVLQNELQRPLKEAYKDRVMDALRKAGLPEKPPLPLPDKPSIAVLPLSNIAGDPKEQYLCDGFTEQIITVLAKTPGLSVSASNTSFTYKGKPVNVQEVGKDLNVRYVLEGSVQKSGDRLRVTAQLIDTATGNHLWAEKYDRDFKDIFDIQDEISLKILKSLQMKLVGGTGMNPCARGTDNVGAYLKFLQAAHFFNIGTVESLYLARQMCQEAIELDPDYGAAYGALAETYLSELAFCLSKSPKQSVTEAYELARKALNVSNTCPFSRTVMGDVYMYMGQYDKSVEEMKAAIAMDTNWADGYVHLASSLRDWNEAIELIEKALRLNPLPPPWYFYFLGRAYNRLGMYEKAVAAYESGLQKAPNYFACHAGLAFTYTILGNEKDAHAEVAEMLKINPHYSLACVAPIIKTYNDEAVRKLLTEGLAKAGLK